MSVMEAEFAGRRDVRNAAIVRELDRTRTRRLWIGAALVLVLAGLLMFTIRQQTRIESYRYEMQRVQQQSEIEARLLEHLLLELDTLRSPARLAARAPLLNLAPPDAAASFVIERVQSSPPPDRSVVAAR
jgi:hypothetical protein